MKITELAKKSIEYFLQNNHYLKGDFEIAENLPQTAGVFVTLHNKYDGSLRGCIGTILPTQASITEEIIKNAVSAAIYDPRFNPLTINELNDLEISIDVLQEPENISSEKELNTKVYGIIVYTEDGRSGLLLPNIDGINTIDEQIAIACKKAKISRNENFKMKRFKVTRYYE
ncbi:MAG TPA: AmmeMemoRadiSam system protein A [bacterium]|nr:AmmeMemoRadiSam system protein A [bacterium]